MKINEWKPVRMKKGKKFLGGGEREYIKENEKLRKKEKKNERLEGKREKRRIVKLMNEKDCK